MSWSKPAYIDLRIGFAALLNLRCAGHHTYIQRALQEAGDITSVTILRATVRRVEMR